MGILIVNNYLLSIDPSIKNTGFTLREHIYQHCKCFNNSNCNNIDIWKPIWTNSYNFEDYFNLDFWNSYFDEIKNIIWNYSNSKAVNWINFLDLIFERGTFHVKMVLVMKHKNI